MLLSDLSVKRPVFAVCLTLMLTALGLVSYSRLQLRELPDINPPVVSVETEYPGASAAIVESRVTQLIEERVAGVEGIRFIESTSSDGVSEITVEFSLNRDIDAAANDVRDRVSRVLDQLPEEVEPPEIFKVDANTDVVMWINIQSPVLSLEELTDYADRYLVDRFSVVDGVARVRIGGGRRYAMRVWLDRVALAARDLTVAEVERALENENVELPAGRVESYEREFTVRVDRAYRSARDFAAMVLKEGGDGHLVRLADVARVELGAEDDRSGLRGNGEDMIGLGIVKQSSANLLDVTRGAKAMMAEVMRTLPPEMSMHQSFDTSFFIEAALKEVYVTLGIAMVLVITVIYVFLGSFRAMLVPALTVPVSVVATCIVLYPLGFSINLLTLLALVLAIGLVVDDAIVVLENISRRVEEGEPPLSAAYLGARQVAFAVVATTLALVAVFVPIGFLEGNVGRLFTEFAFAMAGAVCFSSVLALSLCPMLCSKLLRPPGGSGGGDERPRPARLLDAGFRRLSALYGRMLAGFLRVRVLALVAVVATAAASYGLYRALPTEFAPTEDQARFFIIMSAPEGASYDYTKRHMLRIEQAMMPYVERGELIRALTRWPRSFSSSAAVNSGIGIANLAHWDDREITVFQMAREVAAELAKVPGMRAFPVLPPGLGVSRTAKPVQFVLGGASYGELARWRDVLLERARENPGLVGLDADYKETKPHLAVTVDRDRAADLGVTLRDVGRTLETMMGSRQVTTFIDRGEEYDVLLEARDEDKRSVADMLHIYVRSERSGRLIPLSNLVSVEEYADSATLARFNRARSVTIEANLAPGYTLGGALRYLQEVVRQELGGEPLIDYKGESREYIESSGSLLFAFGFALVIVFLVLAAQFESFLLPLVILCTVPLGVAGALGGLYVTGETLNVFSQIGVIMLIGLATKNGILIVEFANQLRDQGLDCVQAAIQGASLRLRAVLMTTISTAVGALPLVLATGAGAQSRVSIGVTVFAGVLFSFVFTLFVIPGFYALLAPYTRSVRAVENALRDELADKTTGKTAGKTAEVG